MVQPQLQGTGIPHARSPRVRQHRPTDEGFEAFFRSSYRALVATVMRAGAGFQDAEDAVMDAMALAHNQFGVLDNPAAWVRKVALRLYIKRATRDREVRQREEAASRPFTQSQPDDGTLRLIIRDVLHGLPPMQQLIMALTIEGYAPREIAAQIGSSKETVRSSLRHARKAVAVALNRGGVWNG